MKKFSLFCLLFAFAFGLECNGQTQREVVYGTVRTDGYQKITKGAFWRTRPEAKLIYQGSYPDGFKVITLESDYFVRFVDGESNQNDKNYIIFPQGEKVYEATNGQLYSAKCGNRIEYIRPVNMVEFRNVIIPAEKPLLGNYNNYTDNPVNFTKTFSNPLNLEDVGVVVEKKDNTALWVIGGILASAAITTAIIAVSQNSHKNTSSNTGPVINYPGTGGPAPAPGHDAVRLPDSSPYYNQVSIMIINRSSVLMEKNQWFSIKLGF